MTQNYIYRVLYPFLTLVRYPCEQNSIVDCLLDPPWTPVLLATEVSVNNMEYLVYILANPMAQAVMQHFAYVSRRDKTDATHHVRTVGSQKLKVYISFNYSEYTEKEPLSV